MSYIQLVLLVCVCVGWVDLEYCIITALSLGVALLRLVHCLLPVQMRHGDKGMYIIVCL